MKAEGVGRNGVDVVLNFQEVARNTVGGIRTDSASHPRRDGWVPDFSDRHPDVFGGVLGTLGRSADKLVWCDADSRVIPIRD